MTEYTVTTANDDAYGGGDLASETADGGGLSLREAIGLANDNAGDDTIIFDASLSGQTITLGGSDLDIDTNITINGDIDGDDAADITISGNNTSSLFSLTGGNVVFEGLNLQDAWGRAIRSQFTDLTIRNSTISDNTGNLQGAAILFEGFNDLTIENSLITNNSTSTVNVGAIYVNLADTVIISNTTIAYNSASDGNGGLQIDSSNSVTISGSTVVGNEASSGASNLATFGSNITITDSIFGSEGDAEPDFVIVGGGATINFTGTVLVTEAYTPSSGSATVTTMADIFNATTTVGGITAGVLSDNGGVVQTMAINPAGPAAGAGSGGVDLGALPTTDVSGDLSGSLSEDDDTISGSLSSVDPDGNDDVFTADTVSGALGDLTIDASGNWVFDLDEGNGDIQALDGDDTITEDFTISTEDGTERDITISVTGVNDAAVFSGATSGSLTEDDDTVGGDLNSTDIDGNDDAFTDETLSGTLGDLTIDASGNWVFDLDEGNGDLQALDGDDTLTETFTVEAEDGTEQDITISVTGLNDSAVITGDTSVSMAEDDDTVDGDLNSTDTDGNDDVFTADTISGSYGSLTIDASGNWVYDLDEGNAAVLNLGTGGSLQDTITVESEDGTEQDITITISGDNDAPFNLSIESIGVWENVEGVLLGTLSASDDGGSVTFSVSDDRFVVVGNQLWLAEGVSLDYEALSGGTLGVQVTATDTAGASTTSTVTIAVNDVNEIEGTQFSDTLEGSDSRDQVLAGDDDDTILTMDGRDTIEAGGGNDTASGGADNDQIDGGSGDDSLDGGDGRDTLVGGQGGDNVGGGAGNDLIFAGRGDTGDDTIEGGDGDDSLGGGSGNDVILGGNGADVLWGRGGNDSIDGGDGNDTLFNGEGDDTVLGGDGMDTLWAGAGDDSLTGGARADTFKFGAETGSDTITDFNVTEDILSLEFAGTGMTSAADVVAAATATTQGGEAGVLIDLGTGETLFLVGVSLLDVDDINYQF